MPSKVALSREDNHFSRYNEQDNPTIQVWDNGDVDISEGDDRIGLTQEGMFKVVEEWIRHSNYLNRTQRERLKTLLLPRG